jgi:response regulator RpfG family c-di-GMP phosphodiesterase
MMAGAPVSIATTADELAHGVPMASLIDRALASSGVPGGSPAAPDGRPRILCVDDEALALQSLSRVLRSRYDIVVEGSPRAALTRLASGGPFAVLLTDLKMPEMDGITLLRKAHEIAPGTSRVLLTGHADLPAALDAVNEGNVFRLLTKPTTPDDLGTALDAAVDQHNLVVAEHVLLAQTLRGAVRALLEALSLTDPGAFGRAMRAREWIGHLLQTCEMVGIEVGSPWEIEIAAMLSQLGSVVLPASVVAKRNDGAALTAAEERIVARIPEVGVELLASIPRLEGVREIIALQDRRFDGRAAGIGGRAGATTVGPRGHEIPLGARLLKIALDTDDLESQGIRGMRLLETLRTRLGAYDSELLGVLAEAIRAVPFERAVHHVTVRELRAGMVLALDACTGSGTVLLARGHELTEHSIERLVNHATTETVREPLTVVDTR